MVGEAMKMLVVGDPHITHDSIDEGWSLVNYIIKVSKESNPDYIVIMGDLYHNHGVVHLSVQKFWQEAFDKIKGETNCHIIALVGNHDKSGDISAPEHALMLHQGVDVIDKPTVLHNILFMPYTHKAEDFIKACRENPTAWVFAHQEFIGGVFDNGYSGSSANAVDPSLIPQTMVVSGHIHTAQKFNKVWYVGSPRWRTIHDANVEKAIWCIDMDSSSLDYKAVKYPTDLVCRPIVILKDTLENPISSNGIAPNATVTVDIHGTQVYIDQRKRELEQVGCRVRTFPVLEKKLKVKESDGIAKALVKFLLEYQPKYTNSQDLIKTCRERISWLK